MQKLYLSSDIHYVAESIINDIKKYKNSFVTAFITTGAELEDNPKWVDDNRNGMIKAGFNTFDYTLTNKTIEDIESDLGKVDIIHVNGGDCKRIIEKARESGFDKWIIKALEKGIIYTGSSGGSIATAPDISGIYRPKDSPMGLNLQPILIIPHWSRPDRTDLHLKERLPKLINEKHKTVLLNDYQYLMIEGKKFEFIDVSD